MEVDVSLRATAIYCIDAMSVHGNPLCPNFVCMPN
ncbi:hypothetical protein V1281_000425 [Nitrobacteraceae bacterium AZCC 2161]